MKKKPNVVFVFADQLRRQALGFGGEDNIKTPNIDSLAGESVDFVNSVSGTPVCCPARATLLTGQYPNNHGVIINDVPLSPDAETMGKLFSKGGYETGYIGKWHVDGNGRSNPIPKERRHGFNYWKVLECTHDYNDSFYYEGDSTEKKKWEGYDAIAQTNDAVDFLRAHKNAEDPFLLVLSWGPPHDPYQTAPQKYLDRVKEEDIKLRPNVPESEQANARAILKGYYAHILALDDCMGTLTRTLDEEGLADDTVFVFWSDHGDQLLSHGERNKQRPWEESIRVPLLIRYPQRYGKDGCRVDSFIDTPDLLPTLLGMCGLDIPSSVDGESYSKYIDECVEAAGSGRRRDEFPEVQALAESVLISCPSPFGQFLRNSGGREFRGIRTFRYTYVQDLNGPWLLFDNERDPYQLNNLCEGEVSSDLLLDLQSEMDRLLEERGDALVPGEELLERFGYADRVDETGTMPFTL